MNPDQRALHELIAKWHRATAAGDVDAVLQLIQVDAIFLVAGRPPIVGRAAFERGLRQVLKTHRIDSSGDIQEVEVSGDLAYSRTQLTVRMTPTGSGNTATRSGQALSVFRKQTDGSWLLIRDANLLPAAQ